MTGHRLKVTILAALLLLVTVGAAGATTYRELSLTEMLDAAQIAFLGVVAGMDVEIRDGEPWTLVEFEVERMLAGDEEPSITLAFLGGDPPGAEALRVNLMPEFQPGETVLLLAYDEEYYSPVVGFNQGLWRLEEGEFRDDRGRRLGLDEEEDLLLDGTDGDRDFLLEVLADELEDRP